MNVTIVYELKNKTSTHNCVQLLLHNLKVIENLNVAEFYLPENYIPAESLSLETDNMHLIINSIKKSDLIIFASSISNCEVNPGMEELLQTLSYFCMNNSLRTLMYNKIGVIVSTTSSAGLFNSGKSLKKGLYNLGIKHIFKFSETFYELNWNDTDLKTKMKVSKNAFNITYKILNLYQKLHKENSSDFSKNISLEHNNLNKDNVIDITYIRNQEPRRRRHI